MSIALGTTPPSPTIAPTAGSSPVALQAQLDRCAKQLSDWVNCASGKTPEGKQVIAALQEKIGSIKQQILREGSNRSDAAAAPAPVSPPASLALASIGSIGTILNTVA